MALPRFHPSMEEPIPRLAQFLYDARLDVCIAGQRYEYLLETSILEEASLTCRWKLWLRSEIGLARSFLVRHRNFEHKRRLISLIDLSASCCVRRRIV